jgi:hypothetical protein
MSSKMPYRDVLPLPVSVGEREVGASSGSNDPLHTLVRILARQAAREVLAGGGDKVADLASPLLAPEQDLD